MYSKLENQWAQLSAPLELVDKGKYGPEKTFKWKFAEPTKDFNATNDSDYWKQRSGMAMKDIFSQGVTGKDHECEPDDYFRCRYCGIVLKWACYGKINKINDPYEIFYYDYSYIEVHEKKNKTKKLKSSKLDIDQVEDIDDRMISNFTEINYIFSQRDMVLYFVSRQTGQGLSDHQIKKQGNQIPIHIIPFSLEKLQITGDIPLHKDIELYADFESANMRSAIIDSDASHLRIILKSDSNSLGFQQWFFFGVKYKGDNESIMNIVIVNQRKKHTLFSCGMKPYVGVVDNSGVITWTKITTEIIYKKAISYSRKKLRNISSNFSQLNLLQNQVNDQDISQSNSVNISNTQDSNERFSSLQFSHKFIRNGERVLFSYSKPFTYTDLIDFLESKEKELKSQPSSLADFSMKTRTTIITTNSVAYKRELIGGTRLGLAIQLLEITASKESTKLSGENIPQTAALPYSKRKLILILARQHPFETPSSMVCNGFITFLLSSDQVAVRLREIFIFKIVPMLNPDGVAVGNSRTNIAGSDLNRCWEKPNEKLEPEIFYLKQYFKQLKEKKKRDIFIAIDIHATATKNGAFLVGCEQNHGLSSNSNWVSNRLLPKVMQESMEYFNYGKCRFNMLPKNSCTARATLWRELKARYSFNYECSMYGFRQLSENEKIQRKNNERINQLDDSHLDGSLSNTSRKSKTSKEEDRYRSEGKQFKEFEENDYLNMGAEICNNILHFSVITAMIQAEIDKNTGSIDLDLNRLKIKQGSNDLINTESLSSNNSNCLQIHVKSQEQQQRSSQSLLLTKNKLHSSFQGDISSKNEQTSLVLQPSPLPMKQSSQTNEPKQGFFGKSITFFKKIQKSIALRQSSLAESSETGSWIGSFQSNSLEDYGQDQNDLKREEDEKEESKCNEEINHNDDSNIPKKNISNSGNHKKFDFKLNLTPKKLSMEESPLDGCIDINSSLNKITTSSRGRMNSSSSSSKRNLNSKSSSREKNPPLSSARQQSSISSSSKIFVDNTSNPPDNQDTNIDIKNSNILINETYKNSEANLDLASKSVIQNGKPNQIAGKANNPLLLRLQQPASRGSVQYSPQHQLIKKPSFKMQRNSKERLSSLINPIGSILPTKITERDDSFNSSSSLKRTNSIGNGNSTSRSISKDLNPMRNSIFGHSNSLLSIQKNNKNNTNNIKHSSFSKNRMQNRRGAVTSSFSTAIKKKKSQFHKYFISQKDAIKELLPLARSFDWVDYFTLEEVESQIGVAGVQEKLINILINNMDTITEYDTDSAPEDDLISESDICSQKSFDFKQTVELSNNLHSPRTIKILEQLYQRYDSKFKIYLDRLKYDELIGLYDDVYELDENGRLQKKNTKILRKASNDQPRQSDATTISSTFRDSFWSNLIGKNRKISSNNSSPDSFLKRSDSLKKAALQSKNNQENNSLKDDVQSLIKYDQSISESDQSGTWPSAKANLERNNNQNSNEVQSNISPLFKQKNHKFFNYTIKNIKPIDTYGVQSRLLLPKLELIKLRNPFLPSHQEIVDKYNYNSITNSTKFSSGKSPLITLTTFSADNHIPNLHLNPVSRMSPTGLMQIPLQTISSFSSSFSGQNKQYVQPIQEMSSLKRGRQRSYKSLQDNKEILEHLTNKKTISQQLSFNRSYSSASSSSSSKHRLPTREASTDPIKEDSIESQPNRQLSKILSSSYAPSRSSFSVDGSKQQSPSQQQQSLQQTNEQNQQQFLELEPPAFRITNSQFGSRIIPQKTRYDQQYQQRREILLKQQQSAKVLMVYTQQISKQKQETQSRQSCCLGSSKTVISFKRKDLFSSTVKVSSKMF